jgi:uncharacterized protein YbaR (Trm112 family)
VYPLTREEAIAQSFRWQDELPVTRGKETLRIVPDSIDDVPDSILQEILACDRCGRNYRVVEPELQFYRKSRIPVPHLCFFCRLGDLYERRGVVKLWERECQCGGAKSEKNAYKNTSEHFHKTAHCPNTFETAYDPQRLEIIYCEQCYQHEVA